MRLSCVMVHTGKTSDTHKEKNLIDNNFFETRQKASRTAHFIDIEDADEMEFVASVRFKNFKKFFVNLTKRSCVFT